MGAEDEARAGSVGRALARVRVGDLAGIDTLTAEALAVFLWSDDQPLQGVAGFLDWRLCGALSQTLVRGDFQGAPGEVMLLPTRGRLGNRRVFVFGLGARQDFELSSLPGVVRIVAEIMQRAGVRELSVGVPFFPADERRQNECVSLLEQGLRQVGIQVESVLVEPPTRGGIRGSC